MKKVYVVIVNWNGWMDTVECLESLRALDYLPVTVVVCDNGSSDESVPRLRDWINDNAIDCAEYNQAEAVEGGHPALDPWLVLVRTGANLGFAGGNNVALRYALKRGDFGYAWLLNNDTTVEPDALTQLVRRIEEEPSIGMCGSTIRYYDRRDRVQALGGGRYLSFLGLPWHHGRFFGGRADRERAERKMNYVEGASMLVSRRLLEQVGLMSEDYFLYFEEADWARRAAGMFRLGFAPGSVIYHKVGRSIGTTSHPGRKSYTCDFYNIANRILFTRRYHPFALPTVYLVLWGELLIRLVFGRFDRVAMIFRLMIRPPGGRKQEAMRCRR